MANTKSSKKSIRKTAKLTARNKAVRNRLKTLSKKLQASAANNSTVDAKTVATAYVAALDKAAKRNILHINKANRLKQKLSSYIFARPEAANTNTSDTSTNAIEQKEV